MNQEIKLTIVAMALVIASIVTILCFYTDNEIKRLDDETLKIKSNEITLLSSRFELRLQYMLGVIELASQTSPIVDPPINSDLISDQLKGIPENSDSSKREFAKDMLAKKFDLDYVFYAMPNGDIYFLEPYDSQTKLSQLNFAFRDWYRGVLGTGTTYVSEVYVSANEKHNVIGIASPIFDKNNPQTMHGIFVGALHLGSLQQHLAALNLGKNEYLLVVDHNNNIVADSRIAYSDTQIRKFSLDFDKTPDDGNVNSITSVIDGTTVLVTYKKIPITSHEWLVMSIQPYDEAFAASNTLRDEAIVLTVITVGIITISGFFLIRKINANLVLVKQLKRVDVEKEEFSAMVTHELKTPLVPIIGYCKMFKTLMLGKLTDEQTNVLDVIEKNAKRLERLISDLLDVRKLDLNKIKFNIEDVSVDEFFSDLNTSYAKVLAQSGKEFITDVQTKELHIKTDRNRLRQCFDNLISNAIKFTPATDAKIIIGCSMLNNKIIFYIRDNGVGIAPEAQQFLFRKFYQIDTSERRQVGGSGLGLAICKGIIENLGGRIWVESDGKTGSTFYIEFSY